MKGEKSMLGYIISFILGGIFGVAIICCCVVAGKEDERMSLK